MIINVMDISDAQVEDQINVVNQTLVDISAADKPTLLVFNKMDAYHFVQKEEDDLTPETRENVSLEDLKKSWMNKNKGSTVFISATKRTNIDELRTTLIV